MHLDGLVPADVRPFLVPTEERGYDPGGDEEKRSNSSSALIVTKINSSKMSSSNSSILTKMNSSSMLYCSAGCV